VRTPPQTGLRLAGVGTPRERPRARGTVPASSVRYDDRDGAVLGQAGERLGQTDSTRGVKIAFAYLYGRPGLLDGGSDGVASLGRVEVTAAVIAEAQALLTGS
jgi:hypothetical protein